MAVMNGVNPEVVVSCVAPVERYLYGQGEGQDQYQDQRSRSRGQGRVQG